jgi:hypothetical protein
VDCGGEYYPKSKDFATSSLTSRAGFTPAETQHTVHYTSSYIRFYIESLENGFNAVY